MANGTVALMSIFAGIGLEPGDEVITVSHTFAATANAILFTGATPVFVDIEPDTYLIDAKKIEAAITPRTRAICPVHLFGLVADMDMIRAIADRHGLAVVEDACQAHGATFRGRPAGSFGHGAFSLYATKNMTTAEGGFVTTNDDRLADWLRLYRNQGMRARYQFEMLGYNFRLTDLAAAIGLAQFDKLERNTARRQADRRPLRRGVRRAAGPPAGHAGRPDPRLPPVHGRRRRGARRDPRRPARRPGSGRTSTTRCRSTGRNTSWSAASTPTCRSRTRAAARTLALPMFPGLTDEEQDQVVDGVPGGRRAPPPGRPHGRRASPASPTR